MSERDWALKAAEEIIEWIEDLSESTGDDLAREVAEIIRRYQPK